MRALIDDNVFGKPFNEEHLQIAGALCGFTFLSITRMPCPGYPNNTRHLIVQTECGIDGPFSWSKAIRGAKGKERYDDALRKAVREDLAAVFQAAEPKECAYCGVTTNLTVDHVDPPFSVITKDFLASNDVVLVTKKSCAGWHLADPDPWINYHASRSTYQLLCRSCNASKGVKRPADR
jgi:5-methylcytosine-specific restriction endonuclease McrA